MKSNSTFSTLGVCFLQSGYDNRFDNTFIFLPPKRLYIINDANKYIPSCEDPNVLFPLFIAFSYYKVMPAGGNVHLRLFCQRSAVQQVHHQDHLQHLIHSQNTLVAGCCGWFTLKLKCSTHNSAETETWQLTH